MQIHSIKTKFKRRKQKRVGRGGAHGKTSGRGTKGQKARSGHRIRPASRDLLMRIPKLRGYKNKAINSKEATINVGDLEKLISGNIVNKQTLEPILKHDSKQKFFSVKILGGGEIKKSLTIEGIKVSKSAKEKIEKAGGKVK